MLDYPRSIALMGKHAQVLYGIGLLLVILHSGGASGGAAPSFARTSGIHFVMNGRPMYANGFNAYWLMYVASEPSERGKVSSAFQQASSYGMNLARTWAFSDGGSRPLQISPGIYNEDMFEGLDFVISEASKYGVQLILSLANNYNDFGGRNQYVQWARQRGQNLNSDDDFYRNELVKAFYKSHVKAVLTRVNTITGVAYKDDPTIFAWELMNEPRCQSDLSGRTLQEWITDMSGYVKALDGNHMVEVGMEGFYGESLPERKSCNPGYEVGTDFISNHQVPSVDFATIHAYPDQWKPGSSDQDQLAFLSSWIQSHTQDCAEVLRKPLLVAEFGKSSRSPSYTIALRDALYSTVYDAVYSSARLGGPCGGAAFWQLMVEGMDNFSWDGYEVIMSECPSTAGVISRQSRRISSLSSVPSVFPKRRKGMNITSSGKPPATPHKLKA